MYIHNTEVHNLKAPSHAVPLIIDLFHPHSVLDVGCGIGTWLRVFKDHGITDYLGIDGDYVEKQLMNSFLDQEHFKAVNLLDSFDLGRRFDLVISLEVAEHLRPDSAKIFVDSLCKHSENIVFSAAIPGQGGQNHLNEQWPQYWIELFDQNSFTCYDILRPKIWDNKEVDWWYSQNILVFCKQKLETFLPSLQFQSIIHPLHFIQKLGYVAELSSQTNSLRREVELWKSGRKGIRNHFYAFIRAVQRKMGTKSHI